MQQENKIGIISTNFRRTKVFQIFCAGIDRLRKETKLDIPCVVVGDMDGYNICLNYGISHIEHPNKPLTSKFNRACQELRGLVDYVCVMGSDDLITTNTFLSIKEQADKDVDLIGLSDVYFYGLDDVHTGKLIHFTHTTVLGVGRTVSSRVLDAVDWKPWGGDKDRGIDVLMLDTVRPHVKSKILLSGGHVFDLKTSLNLNRIHFWMQKALSGSKDIQIVPDSVMFDNIGSEEQRLIREFINKQE